MPRSKKHPGETPAERLDSFLAATPGGLAYCRGCGVRAEMFHGTYCWLCANGGVPYPMGRYIPLEQHLKYAATRGKRKPVAA